MKRLANLKFMVMAMFVAMLSMSLTACSDDDDDNDNGNYAKSVVGTWQRGTVNTGAVHIFKFNSNGTGEERYITYNYNGQETSNISENISYTYVYNEETGYGVLAVSNDEGTKNYKVKRFVDKLHIYTSSDTYNEYLRK